MASPADIIAQWLRDRFVELGQWWGTRNPFAVTYSPPSNLPPEVGARLATDPLIQGSREKLAIYNLGATVGGIISIFSTLGGIAWGKTYQLVRQTYRPNLLTAEQAAAAEVRTLIDHTRGLDIGGKNGLEDEDYNVLAALSRQLLDAGTLIIEWRRGRLPLAKRDEGLTKLGYSPEQIDTLVQSTEQLPTVQDIVRFAVRELYNPTERKRLDLDADFPEDFLREAEKLGFPPQAARDVWAAHWELPSPTQVFEMLHRRKLTPAEVDDYLKAADYAPVWRPLLRAISYSPLTRVDVRRVFKLGLAGRQLVYDNYRDLGYDDVNAEFLTRFTEADVSIERQQEKELLTAPLRSRAISLYNSGAISGDTLRAVLAQLKYTPEQITRYLEEAEFIREADRLADLAGALKSAYVKGLRTWEDTRAVFEASGFSGEDIERATYGWSVLRENAELSDHQVAERDLTKAEILDLRRAELVGYDFAVGELQRIGYDKIEAALLVDRVEVAREKDYLDAVVDTAHALYVGGRIDSGDVVVRLSEAKLRPEKVQTLVAKWDLEREKKRPDFPLSMLLDMRKLGTITDGDMDAELTANGYAPWQREWLIAYATGKRAADLEKANAKAAEKAAPPLKKMTPAQIVKLYRDDEGMRAEALRRLTEAGYTQRDAELLLRPVDQEWEDHKKWRASQT